MSKFAQFAILTLALLGLAACATTQTADSEAASNDPMEHFNRSVFAANRFADKILLKPLGKGYKAVMPQFARKGVNNFFDNLTTPRSALNNFLQGKPSRGLNEIARFLFNSTLGVAGLFDVAGAGEMERFDEDFSQTLAVWGLPDGPYVVLPLLGPRTMLGTAAVPVDYVTDLKRHIKDSGTRDRLVILDLIDTRARLLTTEELLGKSADPYIAYREAFLQNREFNIHDGDPPLDDDLYFFDEEE